MGIATTTAGTIRAALVPIIEAISPTYADLSDQSWSYDDDGEPSGASIRTFTILNGPSQETPGGMHGGAGIEYDYTMIIRTAYGALPQLMASDLIDEDARDLWLALHPLPDAGGIDGMLPTGGGYDIQFYDDEQGSLVVDYTFEIHYKGRD